MRKRGILLAAPGSGSGKTTITCALLAALKKRNIPVRSFKSGPDYIDPMFHSRVIGIPSRNLDTFFSEASQIQELYDYGEEGMFSVIEGAMGIYDGLGGTQKEGSAYHLAQTLDLPVILVVDAHGMGRTLLALLAGIQSYDTDKRLAGVILNRITPGFYGIIAPLIEEELHIPVLGFFPKATDLQMESRHLGLKMPDEIAQLQTQVAHAAELLEANVNVEKLLEMAGWKEEEAEDKQGAAGSVFDADEKSTIGIICGCCTKRGRTLLHFRLCMTNNCQRMYRGSYLVEAIRSCAQRNCQAMFRCGNPFARQLRRGCHRWQSAVDLCICMRR